MAKFEKSVHGNLRHFTNYLTQNYDYLGASISLEDSSAYSLGEVDVAIYVFERYSYLGKNRVSLNVTCVGNQNEIRITAISSGGSQAMLFKINTWGEESFLEKFIKLVNNYNG